MSKVNQNAYGNINEIHSPHKYSCRTTSWLDLVAERCSRGLVEALWMTRSTLCMRVLLVWGSSSEHNWRASGADDLSSRMSSEIKS